MQRLTLILTLCVIAGVGGALAAGMGLDGGQGKDGFLASLARAEAGTHAGKIFERADLNGDQRLEADEYAALAIVTAELSQLNGYISIETEGGPQAIALADEVRTDLTRAERIRLEAVARAEFYAFAGADDLISLDEYLALGAARFADADRNRNGALSGRELAKFVVLEARLAPTTGA